MIARRARYGMVVSFALLAAGARAEGPKKPETPFNIHVFTRSTDKETVDSTADVGKALQDKKKDWFRVTGDKEAADLVLEILGRDVDGQYGNVIRGRVSAATLADADIVGQHIVSQQPAWKLTAGPWTNAARDMANRLEKYCRATYTELADAQRRGRSARMAR